MSTREPLHLYPDGTGAPLTVRPQRLIVAGYTGRDSAAVAAHIAELAEIGVPPPPSVPAFYDLDPALVTTAPVVTTPGPATSGEVEPVLIRTDGRYYLGVGSDHTDRDLERTDIAASKAACPKPLGTHIVELGGLESAPWDDVVAECRVDGTDYQRGPLAGLRHPADTVDRMVAELGSTEGDLLLFCGTLPLLTGEFVHGLKWSLSLVLPDGTEVRHTYATEPNNGVQQS